MPKFDRELLKADIEDGYTKLSNLLLEALAMAHLSGMQFRIIHYVIRRTYSWGKKAEKISLKDIVETCGTDRAYASRQLKDLVDKKVLVQVGGGRGLVASYSINTWLNEWENCLDNHATVDKTTIVCRQNYNSLKTKVQKFIDKSTIVTPLEATLDKPLQSPKETTKETIKEINNSIVEPIGSDASILVAGNSKSKKTTKIFPTESEEYRLSTLLRQCILNNDTGAKVPAPTPEAMAKWCQDMDKLLRVDDRAPGEVERVITWCQQEQFWKAIILSVRKLREKFTTLKIQSERGESYSKATSSQHSGEDPALAIDLDRFLYQPK